MVILILIFLIFFHFIFILILQLFLKSQVIFHFTHFLISHIIIAVFLMNHFNYIPKDDAFNLLLANTYSFKQTSYFHYYQRYFLLILLDTPKVIFLNLNQQIFT